MAVFAIMMLNIGKIQTTGRVVSAPLAPRAQRSLGASRALSGANSELLIAQVCKNEIRIGRVCCGTSI